MNNHMMALVGDAKWERHLTKLAQPFYAKQTKYFESDDDAWDWLGSSWVQTSSTPAPTAGR
jgi:hypothetical protein